VLLAYKLLTYKLGCPKVKRKAKLNFVKTTTRSDIVFFISTCLKTKQKPSIIPNTNGNYFKKIENIISFWSFSFNSVR